jgi:hypothetical protein
MSDIAPPETDPETATGGKRSAWMTHVKKTMRAHKGMKLMQVLKLAKKTYKKSKKGGASVTPLPLGGGKRRGRGSRSTRKSRRGGGHICDTWQSQGYESRGECVKDQQ